MTTSFSLNGVQVPWLRADDGASIDLDVIDDSHDQLPYRRDLDIENLLRHTRRGTDQDIITVPRTCVVNGQGRVPLRMALQVQRLDDQQLFSQVRFMLNRRNGTSNNFCDFHSYFL